MAGQLRAAADDAAVNAKRAAALAKGEGGPDRRRLSSVQEFFRYTEQETQKFFQELDRDGDGRVRESDLRAALRERRLPEEYARDFMSRAHRNPLKTLSRRGVTWEEFRSLCEEREATMLKVYSTLDVDHFGSMTRGQIKENLSKLRLPASDSNAGAMLEFLGADEAGFVSYGRFRNFLILLPKDKLAQDVGVLWFEQATMTRLPAVQGMGAGRMLAFATLAGGLASGGSTMLLHPIDTVKTQVQAAVGKSPWKVLKAAPSLGRRALYRGIVPAAMGASTSHGVRVCIYEGIRMAAMKVTRGAMEVQIQGLASGAGTLVGTVFRVPCEVLKQQLQTGQYSNVVQATRAIVQNEGPRGLFRGLSATLGREVPFYVLGMVTYEQLRKFFNDRSLARNGEGLRPWEVVAIGALSGAIAAVATTPADVLKTRMMTATVGGTAPSIFSVGSSIVREEGFGALMRGAPLRAAWIAPLGAMNFAGYELAKNAMVGEKGAPAAAAGPKKT